MPAKRPYIESDNRGNNILKIRVKSGDLEKRRSVYFTDQSPNISIEIENIGEGKIEGSTFARLSFDESPDDHERYTHQELQFTLNPGDSEDFEYSADMLIYQGNTALTVDRVSITGLNGEYEVSRYTGPRLERIYTFMVYDRDYYKVNYWRPRYAQYISAFLAVLIVLVGTVQILIS